LANRSLIALIAGSVGGWGVVQGLDAAKAPFYLILIPAVVAAFACPQALVGFVIGWTWWKIVACPSGLDATAGLLVATFLLVTFHFAFRGRALSELVARALGADGSDSAPAKSQSDRRLWWGLGFAIVIVSIVILEVREPFFFSKDDNFAFFLPMMLHGCGSLASGEFATFNPYQLLGAPVSSLPQSTLLYPPTYLSWFAASRLLGNDYLTIEVFCILHLIAGYAVVYWLLKWLRAGPMPAASAAVCVVLSGFSLIGGRSWHPYLSLVVWMPLMVISVERLRRGPVGWRWVLATAAVVGAFILCGYPQTWVYAFGFYVLAVVILTLCRDIPWRRAARAVVALAMGVGVGSILLVPQIIETSRFYENRLPWSGGDIGRGILSLILPIPLANAPHPNNWGSVNYQNMGAFYYSGTLFYLIAALLLASLAAHRWSREIVARNVWLVLAGVAFLFALGENGILWRLTFGLPVLSKFTGPFKFLAFLNLFVAVGAGLAVERLLAKAGRRAHWEAGLGLGVFALMTYHCSLPLPSFYTYGDTPYPPMPRKLAKLIVAEGNPNPLRVLVFAPARSVEKNFTWSLKLNWPTVYGVPSYTGYDPLVEGSRENVKALERFVAAPESAMSAHGVGWILVHRLARDPVPGPNPASAEFEDQKVAPSDKVIEGFAERVLVLPDLTLWRARGCSPMAFTVDNPDRPLPVRLGGSGVSATLPYGFAGGECVINVLKRPWTRAFADGREVACAADEWGRVVADAPAGARRIDAKYVVPWGLGALVGFGLVAACAGAFALPFFDESKQRRDAQSRSRRTRTRKMIR